jgi:hypothetical protein
MNDYLFAVCKGQALEHGLDIFHTAREAQRVLAPYWRRAEAAWEKAEAADAVVAEAKRQGIDARTRGLAGTARVEWDRARGALEQAERLQAAWDRARAALELFGPDGQLNDRGAASAAIAAALEELTGPDWSKLRRALEDRRSLAFLDRMHRRLEVAEPRPDWREAMVWRWWLRHHGPGPSDPRMDLLRGLARDRRLDEEERASYERVAAVLEDTSRARHRRMTQAMLDLKRLYWNTHVFRSGPRKGRCPYRALGLDLPSYDFWELLRSDPERLTQELSTSPNTE